MKNNFKNILNNVMLLYGLFILTCINIGYFLYNNEFQSILFFSISCLIIYLINKNMIIILGLSILFVNVNRALRKKEGFKEGNKNKKKNKPNPQMTDTTVESDTIEDSSETIDPLEIDSLETDPLETDPLETDPLEIDALEIDTNDITENFDNYVYDKNTFNKFRKINSKVFNTYKNLGSVHINEFNSYINSLRSFIDP